MDRKQVDFGREKEVFPLVLIQVKSAAKRTVFDLKNKREKTFLPFKTQLFHIQVVRYAASESAVAEGYGTGYLFFRGELRIGFCTIFAPEIAREMNWKQFIVLLTAILFNAFAYCFASRSPIAFGSETAEHPGLVLTVDCDGGDTACEQGSFGLSNGFSCAYSVLNIKDFHKFISFQPAAESAVVGELRFYESVFNGSVRSGGSLSELRRLNL